MTKVLRIAIGSGVLVTGLAVAGASTASAQVRVRGSFPTPHGRISVDFGHGGFPVGGYVPYGYDVYEDPYYDGYGFAYEDQWYPCEPRGAHWVIVAAPVHYVHREYRTGRSYRSDRYYSRDSRRYDRRGDRGYDRYDRRGDSRYDRYDARRGDRRYNRSDRRSDRRLGPPVSEAEPPGLLAAGQQARDSKTAPQGAVSSLTSDRIGPSA